MRTNNSASFHTAHLNQDIEIGGLLVDGYAEVNQRWQGVGHQLVVRGPTTLQGVGAEILVYPAGMTGDSDFDTDDLTIGGDADPVLDFGRMFLYEDAVVEVDEQLLVGGQGYIHGDGELRLYGAEVAINNGTIAPALETWTPPDYALWIRPSPGHTASIDLDGTTGDGSLILDIGGSLTVDADLSDPVFNGDILFTYGGLTINHPWTFGPGSAPFTMTVDGSHGGEGVINGSPVTMQGGIYLFNAGMLRINAPSRFTSSQVTVGGGSSLVIAGECDILPGACLDLGNDARLIFEAPTTVASEVLRMFDSDLIVLSDVQIGNPVGTGQFDWDGIGQTADTVVGPGAALTIAVAGIDPTDMAYGGTIQVEAGVLTVDIAADEWIVDGSLLLRNGAQVAGDPVNIAGLMTSQGSPPNELIGGLTLSSTGEIQTGPGSETVVGGDELVLDGGQITGSGTFICDSLLKSVSAPTTVALAGRFDMNGPTPGGSWDISDELDVSAAGLTSGSIVPIDEDLTIRRTGRLGVGLAGSEYYLVAGDMTLQGRLSGSPPTVKLSGSTRVVTLSGLNVEGLCSSLATMQIAGDVSFASDSALSLLGGTSDDPNTFEPAANVVFQGGSSGTLIIGGYTEIHDGATFGPNATLEVSGPLVLEGDLAALNTQVNLNTGPLIVGQLGTAHEAQVYRITEAAPAQIRMDVGMGEGVVTHDRLILTDAVGSELHGSLFISTIDGYTPQHGDAFEVITGLNGPPVVDFSFVGGPEGVRAETVGNSVLVRFILCDADMAEPYGTLDFSDVFAFLVAFGSMEPAADLAEPVGVFDFSDVFAFLTAFGAGCP
ncbi:MAG: GC-type dockerin domain-anchored protein [Phycisphaerales bacterium]